MGNCDIICGVQKGLISAIGGIFGGQLTSLNGESSVSGSSLVINSLIY